MVPVLVLLALTTAAPEAQVKVLSALNKTDGVTETSEKGSRKLEVVTGEGRSTDGDGALRLSGTTAEGERNHYLGIVIPLAEPHDLRESLVRFDARTDHPEHTQAFYVRLYNRGETKPAMSFQRWDGNPLTDQWRTHALRYGANSAVLRWEPAVVEERVPDRVDRIEFIIGSHAQKVEVSLMVDQLRAQVIPTGGTLPPEGGKLLALNDTDGVQPTYETIERVLEVVTGEGQTTDGDGALHFAGTTAETDGNHYVGLSLPLPFPVDLRQHRLQIDVRSDHPETTRAFYIRFYNDGETKPALSFINWDSGVPGAEWRTINLQAGLSLSGLTWEPAVLEERVPSRVNRVEVIIGSSAKKVPVDVYVDHLRAVAKLSTLADLKVPKKLVIETPLVVDGRPAASILIPAGEVYRQAADQVAAAIKDKAGAALPVRVATAADREPGETVILLGTALSNPALLVLYGRLLTPVDNVCPGTGGALVQTVHDPFGKGVNAVVLGASDEAGLARAVALFTAQVAKLPAGRSLVLPKLFERGYGEDFLKRFGYADDPDSPARLEAALKEGQRALDTGRHTSIAGVLEGVATRYQLTGNSHEAQAFVKLWDLYEQSAKADPRKFGGPWGFDSDFPSRQVVCGWDNLEEDPSLSDEERLKVTRTMARWLAEAVVPKCAGAARGSHVPHNHNTFPALGTLMAGLYYGRSYEIQEAGEWLDIADSLFRRQMGYFKPQEDCNGYQWLTNGHLMRYCLARPDLTLFENGNAKKIVDYAIGTMNNLGYQVPYGDTGSWQCWFSELICLDLHALVTGDPAAAWAAALKRRISGRRELYSYYGTAAGELPTAYDGVRMFPLEPAYFATFPVDPAPPVERRYDKVAFREKMDPQAAYLLLDGLSNGGHKHLDGNSVEQLTWYDRIWLADNDYFKAQVKYHNSLLVFRDGQSTAIPAYAELLGYGETEKYGYARTRMAAYSGVTWDRAVIWLKQPKAFVVLDRLLADEPGEYQLRLLWHGIGEATVDERGMLLKQRGPEMWLQPAPGPTLSVYHDDALGANWKGYPHADPVVHSLTALARVKLEAGQSYLYATALHGSPQPGAKPWRLAYVDGGDAVLVHTEGGTLAVGLGPIDIKVAEGDFRTDAQVVAADAQGVSLLGATQAQAQGIPVLESALPTCVDYPLPDAAMALDFLPIRAPVANLTAGADAPAHRERWSVQPQPELLVLSGNRGLPGAADLGATLTGEPQPAAVNVFSGKPNDLANLRDGSAANSTDTAVMYDPDQTVTLTIDLGAEAVVKAVRWQQWWAATSSKKTAYLLKKATVAVSSDGFRNDTRPIGEVTDPGPHPDFGLPIEYRVAVPDAKARQVRLVIEPQPGSAVYLAEVLVEGRLPDGAAQVVPYAPTRVTTARLVKGAPPAVLLATGQGTLLALDQAGGRLWSVSYGDRLNDVTAADLDGDGLDEVIVARQDHHVTVLDATGQERWSRKLELYRSPPYVNLVRTGDLDGDGRPEIIAGGENWRFYAFSGDGKELWNYEAVHPSRSGAVADLDGDGQAEVICGTHYYAASVLKSDGTRQWAYSFGPICYDVATGSFDGDQTRGVVFGGGDGYLHYVDSAGKARLKFNAGDEVRRVATGDLDGDGKDEILGGSENFYVYCFAADGTSRWRSDVGSEVRALETASVPGGAVALVGTNAGDLLTFDAAGKVKAVSRLGAAVVDIAIDGDSVLVATADGRLRRLAF